MKADAASRPNRPRVARSPYQRVLIQPEVNHTHPRDYPDSTPRGRGRRVVGKETQKFSPTAPASGKAWRESAFRFPVPGDGEIGLLIAHDDDSLRAVRYILCGKGPIRDEWGLPDSAAPFQNGRFWAYQRIGHLD